MKKILFLVFVIIITYSQLSAEAFYQVQPDSVFAADSSQSSDSLNIPEKKRSHIYNRGLLNQTDYQSIIKKSEIQKMDYKYTGHLFYSTQYSFLRDLGSLGKPDELLFNGYGYNNISYLENGISINNRFTNSLFLNLIQSELIDSIEHVSISRGFLYGSFNNPVSVNFITRDNIQKIPYTRVRILQGSNEEGYVDFIFNSYIYKKLNLTFQATNNSVDDFYENSQASSWKASARLRYLYSSKLNFIGSFNYFDGANNLNGGVLLDVEDIYKEIDANAVYLNREQIVSRHNYNFKIQSEFIEEAPLDISFYTNYDESILKQNSKRILPSSQQKGIPYIVSYVKSTSWGSQFRQGLIVNNFNLDLLANYESVDYENAFNKIEASKSYLSLSGKADITLIDSTIKPTVFAKYLKNDSNNFIGFGGDGVINFTKDISIFGGISYFERPLNIFEENFIDQDKIENKQKFNNLELGSKLKFGDFSLKGSFFYTRNNNELYPIIYKKYDSLHSSEIGEYRSANVERSGINLQLGYNLWNIYTNINASYYINSDNDKINLPEYTLFAELYYQDILFNDNLNLKAGFNFYSSGKQNYYNYDFQQSRAVSHYFDPITLSEKNLGKSPQLINTKKVAETYSIDFFVAGKFQDLAIIYLTVENITGIEVADSIVNGYYIVPHYPKRGLNFRFGISWEFYN